MSSRTVLITGANSGVGLATAKVLTSASSNYHVIISARSLSKAQAAKTEIESENPGSASRVSVLLLDVTDPASIAAARDTVEKDFGQLDALINNAAVGVLTLPDIHARFKASLDTNVIGPACVADAFRALLLKSPNPYSIYVSSGAGSFGRAVDRFEGKLPPAPEPKSAREGAYHVSKAALNMIALREYHLYSDQGLKVFAMCPGFVVSNLRGPSEEMRTGWGKAGSASVSGETLMSILDGKRDADVGKHVHKDGVYPW